MSNYFAGLDWASKTHALCVIDVQGSVVERIEIGHDALGLGELQRRLRRLGSPPIAIERPSGLLVDTLVEAGLTVVPIHPNAVKASRPRYRSHGGKSDASDAYLLADLLRTDGHRFKALTPQSDEIKALQALVRGRDDGRGNEEVDMRRAMAVPAKRVSNCCVGPPAGRHSRRAAGCGTGSVPRHPSRCGGAGCIRLGRIKERIAAEVLACQTSTRRRPPACRPRRGPGRP